MIEVSEWSVKFFTYFYGVNFLPTGTLIKDIRIPVPVVLNMIPYEMKILNYNYSPIPDLFSHHRDMSYRSVGDIWTCLYFLYDASEAFKYLKI